MEFSCYLFCSHFEECILVLDRWKLTLLPNYKEQIILYIKFRVKNVKRGFQNVRPLNYDIPRGHNYVLSATKCNAVYFLGKFPPPGITKVYHRTAPLVPVLRQTNPVHTIASHFSKVTPIINLPREMSPWSFPSKMLYVFLFLSCVLHFPPTTQ